MERKKWRGLLAKLLCVAMLLTLTACGNTDSQGNEGNTQTDGRQENPASGEAAGDPVELTMLLTSAGVSSDEMDRVAEKINEITLAECNAVLEFQMVSIPDHTTVTNMKLASGEQLDIFQGFVNFINYYDSGYLLNMDPYLEYASDILELLGPYADMGKINGSTYGLPALKDIAVGTGIMFRKDIIDELGIDLSTVHGFDELGDVLRAIKKAHPEMTPLMGDVSYPAISVNTLVNLEDVVYCDKLSNSLGVLYDPESTEVVNYYETETFRQLVNYAWEWQKEGLIGSDDLTDSYSLVKAGTAAACNYSYTPKAEVEASANCGMEMVAWTYDAKPLASTTNDWSWCINSACEDPVTAMKVLNLFYTNKEIQNLLAWGIEGEHYEFVDEAQGIIRYPEGLDSTTVGYYQWTKFTLQNNFLQYVMEGTSPTQWQEIEKFNNEAMISAALGFAFNSAPVSTQIAACSNAVDEYVKALLNGQLDPETELPAFIDKLKASGIDEVIAEKQAQLDAWLSN